MERGYFYAHLSAITKKGIKLFGRQLSKTGLIDNPDDIEKYIINTICRLERIILEIRYFSKVWFPFEKLLSPPVVPMLTADKFIKGRILLVNTSLSSGGAERQVVNTILGLKQSGVEDITLLCQTLYDFVDSDFYMWKLRDANVTVEKIAEASAKNLVQLEEFRDIVIRVTSVSGIINQTLLNYITEIYTRRPEVVHLWQDSTNIIGGIAALIVGVPRIVLCTRNMAPYRFAYYQSYMKPGYQVLTNQPNVRFINNSHAGKNDYVEWLDIPHEKITVVLNGLNKSDIPDVSTEDSSDYRTKIGIPADGIVVGSIFRFYAEKDPMLWILTAADIVKNDPFRPINFLLIGTGPESMIESMQALAIELGIADRLFMPGIEKHPALSLSVMDVFLLTSINEGTPNVVIEAQFYGVPVVATDAGGTRDTIVNGTTGWIVESRSPSDLAGKVVEILDDKEWLLNARNLAPIFAKENFGLERMVSDTLAVYDIK